MSEYERGFRQGWIARSEVDYSMRGRPEDDRHSIAMEKWEIGERQFKKKKPKRKLSAWNKFVKANSKKRAYIYQSGAKKGRLNLKKMAVAFRKTPAGRKSKRR